MDQSSRTARDRRIHGIYSATLTPFDRDFRPNAQLAIPYYRSLLERGCDGLNVLGTTGEAMSVAIGERVGFMEAIAGALPRERLMVGTGASALGDAIRLTTAACELGYSAQLVIPPFYYPDVSDDGVFRFFSALFEGVPSSARIVLYHFPRMSRVALHADLVTRLIESFPDRIAGIKDSSNDVTLERELHSRHPSLAIFPGSEALLPEAIENGLAGCISGSVCLWPERAAEAWHDRDAPKALQVRALREKLPAAFIPSVRRRVAKEQANDAWLRSIPPID